MPPFIRNVLARFWQREISAADAVGEHGVSRSRLYVLYAGYLRACARRGQSSWVLGHSGGNHHRPWPSEVCDLLRKLLGARPPASYTLAASEVHRRHNLQIDRASVRRWALKERLAPETKYKKPRQPARRRKL